jgi:hypothetical protein
VRRIKRKSIKNKIGVMINGRPGLFSLRYVGMFGLAGILYLLCIYMYPLLLYLFYCLP